jgi:nicastrin
VLLSTKNSFIGSNGTQTRIPSGILYDITTQQDLTDFIIGGDKSPYVIVLTQDMLTSEILEKLQGSGSIMGILLKDQPRGPLDGYSPSSMHPNYDYGIFRKFYHEWNPIGRNTMFEGFDFPIVSLNQNQTRQFHAWALDNKARKFAAPRYVAEFVYEYAASEYNGAKDCLRSRDCDPIGGQSVWTHLTPLVSTQDIVMSITGADSGGLFHQAALGARSNQASVVANLAAAEVITRLVPMGNLKNNILFAFFTGETWGYIGSKRFLSDIQNFNCKQPKKDTTACEIPSVYSTQFKNITLAKIKQIIEIGQIGKENQFFMHTEKTPNVNTREMMNVVAQIANTSQISMANSSVDILPPGSLHSFYLNNPETSGIMINDFNDAYTNKYYHSQFDDVSNIDANTVCKITSLLANSLYQLAKSDNAPMIDLQVDCNLVHDLIQCLLVDYNCPKMKYFFPDTSEPITNYAGIFRWRRNIARSQDFIYHFMANMTKSEGSSTSCDVQNQEEVCEFGESCVRGQCVKTSTYFHDAYSVAFDYDYDKFYWKVVNENESMYAETFWGARGARAYLRDGNTVNGLTMVLGLLLTGIAALPFITQLIYYRFKLANALPDTPRLQ